MRIYPVEYVRGKRARYCTSAKILFARSRCSGASFLILFTFFFFSPDTRRQENILRNITRARVTGAVWSARHANATRSSYVTAGFQKCRSGMLEMRHLDVEELQRELEFMTTNSLVTRSLGDGTRSGFVVEGERLFSETTYLPLVIYIL